MLEILIVVVVLTIDQVVKYLSELYLSPLGTSLQVIPGVFQLTSAHNTGAAWGMLPGGKWLFLGLTLIVCVLIALFVIRYRKKMTILSRVTLSLLLAGALGNAIDRLVLSYVRDMFYFSLINFPIFNVADSALTVGCILLIADVLFMKERSVFEIKLHNRVSQSEQTTETDGEPKE
ncbi:MAG: signal peptidase II [Clostridia bacterium]